MQEDRMDVSYQSPDRGRSHEMIDDFDPFGPAEGVPSFEALEYFDTPSTTSLSTQSRSSHEKLMSAHVRTNLMSMQKQADPMFPRQTNMGKQHPQPRWNPPPVPVREAAWYDDDMPFDQQDREKPPSPLSIPFDEEPAPQDEFGSFQNNGDLVQATSPYDSLSENEERFNASFDSSVFAPSVLDIVPQQQPIENDDYVEFGLSPGSTTTDAHKTDEDSLFDFEETRRLREMHRQPEQVRQKEERVRQLQKQDRAEDERLKEDERRRKIRAAVAVRRRRTRRVLERTQEDDSSSLGSDQYMHSLQERTQAAFARKNRSTKQQNPPTVLKPSTPDGQRRVRPPGSPSVSFDEKPPSVHHFFTDDDSETEEEDEDSYVEWQSEEQSRNTKSLENELDNVIKDLLFLGSGKVRSTKTQQPAKEEVRKIADKDTVAEGTLSTLKGESVTKPTKGTRSRVEGDNGEDDPFNVMWGFVEGGVATLSSVLGIASKAPKVCSPPAETARELQADTQPALYVENEPDVANLQKTKVEARALTREIKMAPPEGAETLEEFVEPTTSFEEALEFAADMLLGPPEEDNPVLGPKEDEDIAEFIKEFQNEPEVTIVLSLERDPRLGDMALHTARSIHEINGLTLDESAEIELVTQLEFKVVKVGLPLGILFQENGGGCWVAKVFPDGNAANHSKDAIRIGDQLAAVDGRSAINMKVDDICTLISGAENTQSIELTFMRYVGPLHPVEKSSGEVVRSMCRATTLDTSERSEISHLEGSAGIPRGRSRLSQEKLPWKKKKSLLKSEQEKNLIEKTTNETNEIEGRKRRKWFGRGRKPAVL